MSEVTVTYTASSLDDVATEFMSRSDACTKDARRYVVAGRKTLADNARLEAQVWASAADILRNTKLVPQK